MPISRIRSVAALVLAAGLLGLGAVEFAHNPNLHRLPWSGTGCLRLAGYTVAFAALALFRRPAVLLGAALLYAVIAVGPWPIAGCAIFCLGAWSLGSLLLGESAGLPLRFCLGQGLLGLAAALLGWTHFCYPAVLAMVPILVYRRLPRLSLPRPSIPATLLAFALGIQFLLVLKPEVGTDSLAMHLALPAYVALHRHFSFDVHEFLWAAMPQTADWCYAVAYALGGEFAARLLNFANLLAVLGLLYGLARRFASEQAALAVCALFASGPLVQVVTGSLFIDNVLAATLLAGFAALWDGSAAGIVLLALALATKAGALAFLPGLLVLAVRRRVPRWAYAVALPIALYWYAVAWHQTGNPLFPYANEIFHSKLLDTARVAPQFHEALSWRTPAALTFHSGDYIEGTDGAAGFQYFLLLAPALVALAWRKQPLAAWAAAIGLSAFAISFSQLSYLRYLYPEFALLMLPMAAWADRQGAAVYVLMAVAGCGNILYQPAAGWYHRDFVWNEIADRAARAQYLSDFAPARLIVDRLNRIAPGQPALFCEFDHIAGFAGPAYSTNWHFYLKQEGLTNLREAREIVDWVNYRGIRYIASPDPAALDTWPRVLPAFFQDFTEPIYTAGRWTLYRVRADAGRAPPPPDSGAWDDADIRVQLHGSWYRDFTRADAFRRTLTRSDRAGDELSFAFRGTHIAILYASDPAGGTAEIRVDGILRAIADQSASGGRTAIDGLGPGEHVLTLRVRRATVNLDGFEL